MRRLRGAAKLPPGERDFQVFRFVRVELHSTRGAAEVFGISQTRVRQIVSRVVAYLLATAREGLAEDDEEPAGSLAVAEQIARMQLEHLYQKAMEGWRKSQEQSRSARRSTLAWPRGSPWRWPKCRCTRPRGRAKNSKTATTKHKLPRSRNAHLAG